jgi:phenylacetate-CoA ligase
MRRWLVWNLLFRLHEAAKGHATYRILAEMERADRLSADGLKRLQQERLRGLLAHCYAQVPYYRDRMSQDGVDPSDIGGTALLSRLPIMTKADMRAHRLRLRSDNARRLTSFTTGGSSGDPLIFDLGKCRVASRVACRQRVSRWWGLSAGDPEIAIWGSPIELKKQDYVRALRDKLMATQLLSAFEMTEEVISGYLDILVRGRCRQIFGYPSAISMVCRQAEREGRDLRHLGIRAVFVTSEVLYPHQRELISRILNCPVANGYGGRDSGFIAHECPAGGMHILTDAVVVEIVNGRGEPAAPGEVGEIVVTDLYSHEAPFIRYATGDVGALSERRCQCGRPLPLLERLEGRSNDSVVARDGRIINSLALVYPLREIPGVEQFRITQKELDLFHVQIARTREFPSDGEERVRKSWAQLMRAEVIVKFDYRDNLLPDRSGKFRHVISEVSQAVEGAGK